MNIERKKVPLVYEYDGFVVKDFGDSKSFRSPNANYDFFKSDGMMATWGATMKDDAEFFPAPNIADIEITTICNNGCKFCYKSNNSNGSYMTFETFKEIFDKLPKSLTQIAFGADATLESNPDIWKIMQYSYDNGITPNITVANISDETAGKLSKLCGAVAVSRYDDKNLCYDSVKRLTDLGMKQVNIHLMISLETLETAIETIDDITEDPRLKDLNSLVFLSLKTKGRGVGFHPLGMKDFSALVEYVKSAKIGYGFDSCSSFKFLSTLSGRELALTKDSIIPCESTLESLYIDVRGEFYPCSFSEGTKEWESGLSVVDCDDFIKGIWNNERTEKFRTSLIGTKKKNKLGCRECPLYTI